MARNRFTGPNRLIGGANRILGVGRGILRALRPVLALLVVGTLLGGLGYAGWKAVLRSPYFLVRTVHADGSAHLDREEVVRRAGLDGPINVFKYDPQGAEEALLAHPWVASAAVSKALPGTVEVRYEERRPAGVVALGALYLVDGTGKPFVQPSPKEAAGLPLVTGLDRATYQADPDLAHRRLTDALAIARLYRRRPMAAKRRLSNVHLGEGGRTELILGRTRVVLGKKHFKEKILRLERVFAALEKRKVDASYILLSADHRRAIVKETPLAEAGAGSLTMRSGSAGKDRLGQGAR